MNVKLFIKTKGECRLVLPSSAVVSEFTYETKDVEQIPMELRQIIHESIFVEKGSELEFGVQHLRAALQSEPTYVYEKETRDYVISLHVN